MNDLPGRRMRELPLKSCLVCGGDWFREADYYEFLREELLGYSWPTWPTLVGQASPQAKPLLVCLCGAPQAQQQADLIAAGRRAGWEVQPVGVNARCKQRMRCGLPYVVA
jgi:hypothetical protein